MRRITFKMGIAIWATTAPLTYASTILDNVPDQSYLNLALQPQYAAVARIDFTQNSTARLASGTLISHDWVLTAAHVVSGSSNLKFTIGGVTYLADSAIAEPHYDGNVSHGNDIGLIHLFTPVPGITPATREINGSDLKAVATYVGFGKTGSGYDGATTLDFKERAVQNTIDLIDSHSVFLADFDSPHDKNGDFSTNVLGSATPLPMEGSPAPGDSGGGVFVDRGGTTYLAGVVSYGTGGYHGVISSYGSTSGADEISPFNDWIDTVISPEPGSLGLLSLGTLGLLTRRKRV